MHGLLTPATKWKCCVFILIWANYADFHVRFHYRNSRSGCVCHFKTSSFQWDPDFRSRDTNKSRWRWAQLSVTSKFDQGRSKQRQRNVRTSNAKRLTSRGALQPNLLHRNHLICCWLKRKRKGIRRRNIKDSNTFKKCLTAKHKTRKTLTNTDRNVTKSRERS